MSAIINWIEATFGALPLPLLEVWGRFAYLIGIALAIIAFGGFTFRPGGRWGFGRERQAWDAKAVLSIPLTFILIIVTGYIGSSIVLVPGAQTFESLKDLVVFLCIVLFGYPALITVPFAYGLSDLIEGVPPALLAEWLPGYFINPACFWIAYQLFGKDPDFRRARTWGMYLLFVLLFMAIEPVLWGYICAGKFTSAISYRNITSALFFTTSITWIMAPLAMLMALPLARKFGMFWAEIPGHVKGRPFNRKEWVWEAGGDRTGPKVVATESWPIRMVVLTPFIAIVLIMVGTTAYVTLRSARDDANKLAKRLQQEISDNINFQLDRFLAQSPKSADAVNTNGISNLLKGLPVSQDSLALVINRSGTMVASSAEAGNAVVTRAIAAFNKTDADPMQLKAGIQFQFDHVTEKPLSRETWLARATAYQGRLNGREDWIVLTVMPESFYMAGAQAGNSRSAMIFAVALLLSLAVAAYLAALVTDQLRRISLATQSLANGDLSQRVPGSRLEELDTLARSFNDMAERRKQSEERLAEGERKYRELVEHANSIILRWNSDGRITFLNEFGQRFFGYSAQEIFGCQMLGTIVPPTESGSRNLQQLMEQIQTDPEAFELNVNENMRRNGERVWISWTNRIVRDARGQVVEILSVGTDISERNRAAEALRASEERYRTTLECMIEGCQLIGFDWRYLYLNDAAAIHNRRPNAELLGRKMTDVWPGMEGIGIFGLLRRCMEERVALHEETEFAFPDRSRGWFDVRCQPVPEGIFVLSIDISERKKAENALRVLNQTLELQVIERTAELQAALVRAEAADQIKSAFLATMSHELRTPLNSIIGFTGIILLGLAGPVNVEQRKQLEMVRNSARHLLALINDVLDISKIEAGQLEVYREPFDLRTLLVKVVELVRPLAEKKDLALRMELAPEIAGLVSDSRRVEQVLLNLLNNAIKFTQQGAVTLSAEVVTDASHSALRISVTDTGIGIQLKDLNKLFQPFRQIDSGLTRQHEGTGLGLAICQRLAGLLGGEIRVVSKWGRGSVFTLILPMKEPEKS